MAATSINILKCKIFTSTSPLLCTYSTYTMNSATWAVLQLCCSRRESRIQRMDGNNDIWREGVINAYNFKVLNLEYVYVYGMQRTPSLSQYCRITFLQCFQTYIAAERSTYYHAKLTIGISYQSVGSTQNCSFLML